MTRRLRARPLAAAGAAALLAGCSVGPDFHRPTVAAPLAWGPEPRTSASVLTADPVDPRWWRSFHDPELDSLVTRLAGQNLDLEVAAERVQQADAQRQITRSEGLPHIDERSDYVHERQSPNGFISLVEPAPYAPYVYDLWENSLSASWQIDLFGRVRRAVEANRADTLAAIEARHAIALSAIADLAQDYLQLRGTEQRDDIANANLKIAEHNQHLVQQQFDQGVATTLNLAQAAGEVATIRATLPPLHAAEASLGNALALLLAEPPRALEAELEATRHDAITVPPVVPIGLPSTLIDRRPDIREAEAELHAATANTAAAVANFYPDVSFTGSFGDQGRIVGNAFSFPDRIFMISPAVDVPLFEGGQLEGTLHLRKSQQRQAALRFRQTLLSAWQDVDNALTAYATAQQQRDQVRDAVAQDQKALGASQQNFQQGSADFLNVTSAQVALLQEQDQLAVSDTTIETDLVGLYKALGGGWDVVDPTVAATQARTAAR